MPASDYARIVAPLRQAAVHAAGVQWGALGFGAAPAPARAIVDPEALVLATLALEEHERRLARVMHMWIGAGSRLLSSGRLANLMRDYPEPFARKVAAFAAEALAAGDARWKPLAGKATARAPAKLGVKAATPDLRLPATLMLRLRLALGVGIKADALAFLLGRIGTPATIREIAASTRYYDRAVRRAVEDLAAARLVEVQATSPISYCAKWAGWEQLLGVNENNAPLWRSWHELYVCVVALGDWGRRSDETRASPYVRASRLRDAFERITPLLVRAQVAEQPDWSQPPEAWLHSMRAWVADMAHRLRAVV